MTTINNTIPSERARVAAYLINQVGFPIVACGVMFWLCFSSLSKITKALEDNTRALTELSATSRAFQAGVVAQLSQMLDDLREIKTIKR